MTNIEPILGGPVLKGQSTCSDSTSNEPDQHIKELGQDTGAVGQLRGSHSRFL